MRLEVHLHRGYAPTRWTNSSSFSNGKSHNNPKSVTKIQDPLSISSSFNGCHIQTDRENTSFRHINAYKQAVDKPICAYKESSYPLWLTDGIIRPTESTQHSITSEDIFTYLCNYKIQLDVC